MTSKSAAQGSINGHYTPPLSISSSDRVLFSALKLPDGHYVLYAVFRPLPDSLRPHEALELARRAVVSENQYLSLLECVHCTVRVAMDDATLYLYAITPHGQLPHHQSTLDAYHFDDLYVTESSTFSSNDLYPCSLACSYERIPCPNCPGISLPDKNMPSPNAACLLPRRPLRRVYMNFVDALRTRIIQDIVNISMKDPEARAAHAYQNGFLLGPARRASEWSGGWEHHTQTRGLVHCILHISLQRRRILIETILQSTPLYFLTVSPSLPAGAPITLLPSGAPAFYLASYSGPNSALTVQFQLSLNGLGAGEWGTSPLDILHSKPNDPTYLIVWIAVQNKNGEDKGIIAIWPTGLVRGYQPSTKTRAPLKHIPELVQQLQPSPTPESPQEARLTGATVPNTLPHDHMLLPQHPMVRRACTSLTNDSIRAFRSLAIARIRDIRTTAVEVSGYVESIAKERERERERARKERGSAGTSPETPHAPSINTHPTPAAASPSISSPATVINPIVELSSATISASSPYTSHLAFPTHNTPGSQYYPSPPHTNPPSSVPYIPDTPTHDTPPSPRPQPPQGPVQAPMIATSSSNDSHSSFNIFTGLDSSWGQSNATFVSMDFDMGFGSDPVAGEPHVNSAHINMDFDADFGGAFTDDDFSFFDRPSVATSATQSTSTRFAPMIDPAVLGASLPSLEESSFFGPENTSSHEQWSAESLGEPFLSAAYPTGKVTAGSQLPPSPTKTPLSRSGPTTPHVLLLAENDHSESTSGFDPVLFATAHRQADSKYAYGKYSLPSPPDEEDRTEHVPILTPLSRSASWKSRYSAITDPRITVVRQLIGVKRKSFDQGSRPVKMSPSWVHEHEEWDPGVIHDDEDEQSQGESDSEELEGGSPMQTRPSTPLPSYLPPGPSLLHNQFSHSQLLSSSTPLRPPGAGVAPTNMSTTPAPVSVPTPVSPAALFGAASEKTKTLEAAALAIAQEVLGNPVWADAWHANISRRNLSSADGMWQADSQRVHQLLTQASCMGEAADLQSLLQVDTGAIEMLQEPLISVGKSEAVIQVLPSALRFWGKLGLGPRSGEKNITAFALFQDQGDYRRGQVKGWLQGLSEIYSSKHLGNHTLGKLDSCPEDGLVPLQFDAFRKTFTSFIEDLPMLDENIVLYVVTPVSIMSLASPILRQIISAVKKVTKKTSGTPPLVQFVPEDVVTGLTENPAALLSSYDLLSFSVYNRILSPVDRVVSRRLYKHGEDIRRYFEDPAFCLARPINSQVQFVRDAVSRSLDTLDRHTLLHVGYQMSPCGKWLVVACIDQRGEGHDIGVWLDQSESGEFFIITQVWKFAVQFARKANVEWRIAIAKLGAMDEYELDSWMLHLSETIPTCQELPMIHVTLLSVEYELPGLFMSPETGSSGISRPSPMNDAPGSVFVDSSATTYMIVPGDPWTTLKSIDTYLTATPETSMILDPDDSPKPDHLHILPLATSLLIRVPANSGYGAVSMLRVHRLYTIKSPASSLTIPELDTHRAITNNYHELAVLSQARWHLSVNPLLPFHLASLEVIQSALFTGDHTLD